MTSITTCFLLFLFAFMYAVFGIVIWVQPLLYLAIIIPVILFVLFLCYLLFGKK